MATMTSKLNNMDDLLSMSDAQVKTVLSKRIRDYVSDV
jgi:hypothetical protein